LFAEAIDLVEHGGVAVGGNPERLEQPAQQAPVVQVDRERAERELAEDAVDHRRQLGVVREGELVLRDDVDVGLIELAVAALLRARRAHALDLVAAERKVELVLVLRDGRASGTVRSNRELGRAVPA
jgi:hypothetical protein